MRGASLERSRRQWNVIVRGGLGNLCVYKQQTRWPGGRHSRRRIFHLILGDCTGVCVFREPCGNCIEQFRTSSHSSWKNTIFQVSKACVSKMPVSFLLLTFKESSFWACFCQVYVKLLFPKLLCSLLHSYNPSLYWLAVVITFYMKAPCWKPVMSFCPRGSCDEVEVGYHPRPYNSLRWGIQKCHGLLIESYLQFCWQIWCLLC